MVNSSKVSDKETSSDAGSIQKDPQIAKEAKKNDKKAPLAPIHQFYHEALSDYPVLLRNTKTKGRHAVASRALDEGTTVCLEQAAAFIVRSPYLDEHCHVCLDTLTTKLMCSDCKKSFYCSQKCLEKDDTHSIVCSAFSQVDAIGRATDVEPDMLRLIALLLARRQRDNEKNKSEDPKDDVSSLKKNPTPYWCVEELISHRDRSDPAFIKVMTEAAQRLLSELPESAQIPADDVATLACRINSNAHGLGDNDCRNTDVALGLFPLGAMFFNHACNPNCVFVGMKGDQLAFRTIRPVQQDEELTVSYIDVYASRDERRQDLLYTKHFWCRCKRCSAPMKASVDRYLQSIVCENCCNDVYVIPPSPMEKLIQGESNETKAPEQEEWKCASCGHAASARHVAEALRHAKELYQEGIAAIQRERDYQRAKSKLEPLAKVDTSKKQSLAGALHPQNAVRFNATIPLMNSFRRSQDIKSAIDMNRLVLERFEEYAKLSLPKNTPEISDFYQNLGELCDLMAEKCKASGRGPLERKWQKEARAAFANAAKVRSVVYGADHPKTRFAKKYVSHAYVRR